MKPNSILCIITSEPVYYAHDSANNEDFFTLDAKAGETKFPIVLSEYLVPMVHVGAKVKLTGNMYIEKTYPDEDSDTFLLQPNFYAMTVKPCSEKTPIDDPVFTISGELTKVTPLGVTSSGLTYCVCYLRTQDQWSRVTVYRIFCKDANARKLQTIPKFRHLELTVEYTANTFQGSSPFTCLEIRDAR